MLVQGRECSFQPFPRPVDIAEDRYSLGKDTQHVEDPFRLGRTECLAAVKPVQVSSGRLQQTYEYLAMSQNSDRLFKHLTG